MEIRDVEIKLPDSLSGNRFREETSEKMFSWIEEAINSSGRYKEDINKLKTEFKLGAEEINIMIVGAIGCGKSSTINALLSCQSGDISLADSVMNEYACVGIDAMPETRAVQKYEFGHIALWDTPGLDGDIVSDRRKVEQIRSVLREHKENGSPLIDLILVIVDASSKDLGTTYKLLEKAIFPEIGHDFGKIIVGINQSDLAIKNGVHWDHEQNIPDQKLKAYLKEKKDSIRVRLKENVGIDCEPICYAAGYTGAQERAKPYNILELLMEILRRSKVRD